jgi:molybdopterin synthase sulfur carrier subunit
VLEVNLSRSLRASAHGAALILVEATSIRELLRKVVELYPLMQSEIDKGVAVSINGQIFRDSWSEAIPPNAEVFLLPRIPGG